MAIGRIITTEGTEKGFYLVDLDDCLAKYIGPSGNTEIGPPNPEIVYLVTYLHEIGHEVRLFTARAGVPDQISKIEKWLKDNNLEYMIITNVKDYGAIAIIDDKAVTVTDGKLMSEVPMTWK
jgi:hypothetical protein